MRSALFVVGCSLAVVAWALPMAGFLFPCPKYGIHTFSVQVGFSTLVYAFAAVWIGLGKLSRVGLAFAVVVGVLLLGQIGIALRIAFSPLVPNGCIESVDYVLCSDWVMPGAVLLATAAGLLVLLVVKFWAWLRQGEMSDMV